MKLWEYTFPIIIFVVVGLLYLLQSCGGVHYDSYVEDYKGIAMKEMQRTGYPASIKLAQAILESQGGRGKLAFDYNNHFGIICGKNWPGKKYYQEEEDIYDGNKLEICYRVYNSPEASFVAHTDLVRKEFRTLFHKIDPMDYVAWANRLAELQYSDSDTYDATLINMIERYHLDEFDQVAMGIDGDPIARENIDYPEEAYDYNRNIPSEFDERKDRYKEDLKDLEENIQKHRRQYTNNRRTYSSRTEDYNEDDYGQDDYSQEDYSQEDYRQEDYRQEDYRQEDDYYSSNTDRRRLNKWEDDLPTSYDEDNWTNDQYNSYPTKNTSARYSTSSIDDKYEGFSTTPSTYQRPSKRYDNEPSKYDYDRPKYNQKQSKQNYERSKYDRESPTTNYKQEYWEDTESTSISDFKEPEDYAYINGVKVTTARYDDTPLLIAKRYNLSVKDLIEFNENIKSTRQLLREDQKVFLAAKKKHFNGNRKYHIVQFGERMENIAYLYGLTLKSLYDKNRMSFGSEPALGERIKLDKGKIKRTPELRYKASKPSSQPIRTTNNGAPPPTPITDNFPNKANSSQEMAITTVLLQPVTTGRMYHTVREGENLYRIASTYGVTVDAIKSMNHLTDSNIKRGMRLKVK